MDFVHGKFNDFAGWVVEKQEGPLSANATSREQTDRKERINEVATLTFKILGGILITGAVIALAVGSCGIAFAPVTVGIGIAFAGALTTTGFVSLAVIGVLGAITALGAYKFVQERNKPKTEEEELKDVVSNLGGDADLQGFISGPKCSDDVKKGFKDLNAEIEKINELSKAPSSTTSPTTANHNAWEKQNAKDNAQKILDNLYNELDTSAFTDSKNITLLRNLATAIANANQLKTTPLPVPTVPKPGVPAPAPAPAPVPGGAAPAPAPGGAAPVPVPVLVGIDVSLLTKTDMTVKNALTKFATANNITLNLSNSAVEGVIDTALQSFLTDPTAETKLKAFLSTPKGTTFHALDAEVTSSSNFKAGEKGAIQWLMNELKSRLNIA